MSIFLSLLKSRSTLDNAKKPAKEICQNTKGFSLVELSVIVTISSMVMVTFLHTSKGTAAVDERRITMQKINTLEKALNKYAEFFGHFPCPASAIAPPDSDSFGVSNCGSAGVKTITTAGISENAYIGAVPVTSLGLRRIDMIDGWGKRIAYAVSENSTSYNNYKSSGATGSSIVVLNKFSTGTDLDDQPSINEESTHAAWFLLSYGKDGKGATGFNGTVQGASSDNASAETINLPDSGGNFDHYFIHNLKPSQHTALDDITAWGNKKDVGTF